MLNVFTLDHTEEWDSIVRTFQDHDIYWMSGYVKAFYLHGDGIPLLLYYTDDNTRAINVVMKRDISDDANFQGKLPKGKYFDLSTPYGYGGWLIEGVNKQDLFKQYFEWCLSNNIISEFVRYHPVIGNYKESKEYYEIVDLGDTVCLDLESPEIIFGNLTSKNRNMIRKAKKNGVKIYNGRFPKVFETFKQIYDTTMDKDLADSYYYFDGEFYDSLCEDLKENSQVFFAMLEGKMISASIILSINGKMNYHLSGTLRDYYKLAPNNLLLYQAALWGSLNGYKTFHLGGGLGSKEDSLFKFKKSFNRSDNFKNFKIGKKIFDSNMYNYLTELRTNIWEKNFFPQYRG